MSTHRADNIYYITRNILQRRADACHYGARTAVEQAQGRGYAGLTEQVMVSLTTARKVAAWQRAWLLRKLFYKRLVRDEDFPGGFRKLAHGRGPTPIQFMNVIEAMAIRQGKLAPR